MKPCLAQSLVPCLLIAGSALPLGSQVPGALAAKPLPAAVVEVTATRFPEDPAKVPASISVYSAKDLAERGATDLRSALALAAGVSIAPGGDSGPASSVPEFWGLKEFDAFLLVLDGVPWGGAFNPALATLSLEGVERIEVQRGAAPVMYGATSFVGVIQVIHSLPADTQASARLSLGTHGSGGAAVSLRLPSWAGLDSSLTVDHDKQGFEDDRTAFKRTHLLWRNRTQALEGVFHFDLEGAAVDQMPASPVLRTGKVLTTLTPLDSNQNPGGAYLNDRRVTLTGGYDRTVGTATLWTTTLSLSRARQDVFRGFLTDVVTTDPNAHGFRERVDLTDIYFDSHLTWMNPSGLKVVAGLDHLHGQGVGRGGDFDYFVNLDGSNPPSGAATPSQADIRIDDQRDLTGLYVFAQWQLTPRWAVEGGLRVTRARETRQTATLDFASGDLAVPPPDAKVTTRLSGSLGATWMAWQAGEDRVNAFAGLRSTFKPGAMDFGLDSAPTILKPETATSYDLGLKADLMNRRLSLEVSAFLMDFRNLVVPQSVDGVPSLTNAGTERFRGVEVSAAYRFQGDLTARLAYSYHDTRFRDYVKDFDGTMTQLAGKRLEMSPYHLGGFGLAYVPARGLLATAEMNYVGSVFLNQRNTAPAAGYATYAASLGWREKAWEVRLSGQNLTDQRKPVAESELGDAQYYLLPGRQVTLSTRIRF
jgi:iron complex outermembrane receptor protein